MNFRTICCSLALLLPSAVLAQDRVVELRVFPETVSLTTSADYQNVIVQAVQENGITRDISKEAEFQLNDASLATLDGNVLRPQADGETKLTVSFEGQEKTVPVTVAHAQEERPIRFQLDVMPVFTKSGCNSGSCHGAARGKDGFMLSLFGYDPQGDQFRITREMAGRRINLGVPERSLIVEKATGVVPHTGGKRIEPGSEYYDTLVRWVDKGAPSDPEDVPTCTSIEVYPKQTVLDGPGATQQITVVASYSDGTTRDVTSLALCQSNNEPSAEISKEGIVTAGDRGESFIIARYDVHTVGVQVITLPKDLEYEQRPYDPVNYIDELVQDKLKKLRLHPSEKSSDEEFLRRVYIDLVGVLPTNEEYAAFMADKSPDKRADKVDELMGRREFTEIWVSKWAEWLMMRSSNQVAYKSIVLYYNWLADQIGNNVPVDEMVKEILTSEGGTFTNPPTNFYELERDALKRAENVAQTFMGMRIQCAQCHNHPFDRWTQDDYYSFAAFFAQIGRKNSEDYREKVIYDRGGGSVRHPVTNQAAEPVFLGGGPPENLDGDIRKVLADWLASPENPYFAQNVANRVWAHFFGIGIVDPIDDVRVSNPPSNPQLLTALGNKLEEYDYDFRKLVRDICLSNTYQRTTERNESNASDEANFAHQTVRRIKAESMLDILSQVTETNEKFRGLPEGARAVQIADGATTNYFLTTFGRASRETVCTCEVKMEPTLSQALHLLNGSTVNNNIRQGNVIGKLKEQGLEPMEIVEQLYIRCFTRKPTKDERAHMEVLLADAGDNTDAVLEDIFWSLLNSREMLFNH